MNEVSSITNHHNLERETVADVLRVHMGEITVKCDSVCI